MVSAWGYSTDARIRGPRATIRMLFAGLLAEVVEPNIERLPEMAQRVHDYVIAKVSAARSIAGRKLVGHSCAV